MGQVFGFDHVLGVYDRHGLIRATGDIPAIHRLFIPYDAPDILIISWEFIDFPRYLDRQEAFIPPGMYARFTGKYLE